MPSPAINRGHAVSLARSVPRALAGAPVPRPGASYNRASGPLAQLVRAEDS